MTHAMTFVGETGPLDVAINIGFVLIVIAGLIGAIAVIRKRIVADQNDDDPSAGFTLGSLRQLVRDGKMTQEEFDKAKAQIVVAMQRSAERKKPLSAQAPEPKVHPSDPH